MASKGGADGAGEKTLQLENTEKRDALTDWERKIQQKWADEKVFEADAPTLDEVPDPATTAQLHEKNPKFFGTMAFPYTNGLPHLGHGFTISKIEFMSRSSRHLGKRVLYPQGYHVTGMPIKAAADKIRNELQMFGENFEVPEETVPEEPPAPVESDTKADVKEKTDITKFRNDKRGKAALKGTAAKYQFQTMLSMGVERSELHKFAESRYWVDYFPTLWKRDLNALGCSIDWRRSFVTTDLNPYFNTFVEWQMRKLKALNRIRFGKRYTIYSPKDQQACLDHDRASGEGVTVQEYTALKMKVSEWAPAASKTLEGKLPAGANVFMVAATLRPETMYGQTNLFVSPNITYGIFQATETDFYLVTNRAARNMAFQEITQKWGEYPKVTDIAGKELIGTQVEAPLSVLKTVRVLPMDTIKENKGTGVVTSVPSDSPDDHAMSVELRKKAAYYQIDASWIPETYTELIETPTYGRLTAVTLVEKMKIQSPKDPKLPLAKEEAYKEGFYKGVMVYGEFSGKPVSEAKDMVRQKLIKEGSAFAYSEPDGLVMSRSGDECVAALLDQWFLTYGEADPVWRDEVLGHVKNEDGEGFQAYAPETANAIERTLGWMNQWAVTRQFGLGTKLPWDKTNLVESLSDSTIYMSYYTVAHFLHSDLFATQPGTANIKVEHCTDEFWQYVFDLSDEYTGDIDKKTLDAMRREFKYWYPLDVRTSGKDLLNNHLIFFLYIHQAIWGEKKEYLPRGIRVNGHALLNGEKMSKSTGNFLTLEAATKKYGSDAIRLAFADAGDGTEDANIDESTANATILKLFELRKWCEEAVLGKRELKDGETFDQVREAEKIRDDHRVQRASGSKMTFWDEIFMNEMNILATEAIKQFEATNFKAALKAGYYDFTGARDAYRVTTTATGGMHAACVDRYVELQAHLLAVITPHWSDYIWLEVLKKPTTITNVVYPSIPTPDARRTAAMTYSRSVASNIGSQEGQMLKKAGKGKSIAFDPSKPKKLTIFLASSWPEWQENLINLVRENLEGLSFDVKKVTPKVDKKNKKAMPFIMGMKKKLDDGTNQTAVFDRALPFDEAAVLEEMLPGLKATVPRLKEIEVVKVGEGVTDPAAATAEPGNPGFGFVNVEE